MQPNIVKVNQINDVKRFSVNNDLLACVKGLNNQLSIFLPTGELQHEYSTLDHELGTPVHAEPDGLVWINRREPDDFYTVVLSGNKFQKTLPPFMAYLSDDHSSYRKIMRDEQGSIIQKLDASNKAVWKTKLLGAGILHPTLDYFIFRKGLDGLTTLNNQTGEALWTYTLPDKAFDYINWKQKPCSAQIRKILGVYQQNVWLLISNDSIIALDLKTGQKTAHLLRPVFAEGFTKEQITYFTERMDNQKTGLFYDGLNVHLDTETGTIFGFSYESYGEIDLTDPSYPFTFWSIKSTLASQIEEGEVIFDSLRVGSWEKNHVYVFPWTSKSKRFGIFDRNTRSILWSECFDGLNEGWGAIKDLKYSNGHLYIHAKVDNALHIYQLNENSK